MSVSGSYLSQLALAVLLCLSAAMAQAAGIKIVQIPSDTRGPALKAIIWTPCAETAGDVAMGPFVLKGRRDCPVVGKQLPLVVISHGHGGSFLDHHDLAETLADAGFIVAAINHPGDTFSDMSHGTDIDPFVERPTDIKRLIDYMLRAAPDAARIDPQRIGFFGFSRGGYTGLVLAGGNPDFLNANVPCPDPALTICQQLRNKDVPTQPLTHDPRIKAFVLADPLNEFPNPGNLTNVKAPIQLWASQFGGDGVLPETTPALANALAQKPELNLVSGAAHFAFFAPCSAILQQDSPQICIDGNGFDRVAFHKRLNEKALNFFATHLR
ncbi:alpha/beta hydrolase [Pseudomonas gingeri]|uniref:alpha/beta hydrolase family protein n=1 Tax=Pseudomonas gingeri TaxID=117681 RepID=UPI0015A3FF6F|nr:alpha/beta fold hydrolase [Pseudomonas gingeri]NWA24650.1 alpha/beta hydrolase [Pseudomonas gingeri]NWD67267.1 alpha/beta hydrolase [Pseudomonas gingeri]NWD77949.1 alpha/beta hydrolase [Pseudomonas gingeri]